MPCGACCMTKRDQGDERRYQRPRLAPHRPARYTLTMIAAPRLDEPCRQRHAFARRKLASGGLWLAPRHRLSRWPSQPTDAPRKNRPSCDRARRGAPMQQRVTIDPSCAGNAAANDPAVQVAVLAALKLASASGAEFGFFASENIFSSGYSAGLPFSSGHPRDIMRSAFDQNQLGFFASLFNGTYIPSLFIHTHQNNPPPSPISRLDKTSAALRKITYAAIDRAGTLTCSRHP